MVDSELLGELKELLDKISRFEYEDQEDRRKVEKLMKCIKDAEETIERAESKKEGLQKRNELLRTTLENRRQTKREALEYWKDYGFDVAQLSKDGDSIQEYEFLYSKLSSNRKPRKQQTFIPVDGDNEPPNENDNVRCAVRLRLDENLQIVSQAPERLSTEQIEDLNSRLTPNCIGADGVVDYKLAMLMIRRDLIKSLSP